MSEIIDNNATMDEFTKKLFTSADRMRQIRELTNDELAEALLFHIWADLEVLSLQSDLVESAIERLKDDDN